MAGRGSGIGRRRSIGTPRTSLHQNYKHLKTIQSRLGLSDDQVCSLVVFVGDSTFKTPMPDNVTRGLGFIRFIKSQTSVVLTTVQVKTLVEDIARGREAYLADTPGSSQARAGDC